MTNQFIPLDKLPPVFKEKLDALHPRHKNGEKHIGIHFKTFLDPFTMMAYIDGTVNSMRYVREIKDNWKTPLVFFRDGGGDCEDFAIAKFHALNGVMGMSAAVCVCQINATGEYHAVLIVDVRNASGVSMGTYVLDNLSEKIVRYDDWLLKHTLIYSTEGTGIMYHLNPTQGDYNA